MQPLLLGLREAVLQLLALALRELLALAEPVLVGALVKKEGREVAVLAPLLLMLPLAEGEEELPPEALLHWEALLLKEALTVVELLREPLAEALMD